MNILNTISLESNSQLKINFNGDDLSSDAGLLLLKEFCCKIGAVKRINRLLKTNDPAWFHVHKDDANLLQVIYRIIAAYFEDDCADKLTNEPVMSASLEKDVLASQPTLSRFFHRMDETTLEQFNQILRELRKVICSIKMPEFMLFDIDTTLLDAYANRREPLSTIITGAIVPVQKHVSNSYSVPAYCIAFLLNSRTLVSSSKFISLHFV